MTVTKCDCCGRIIDREDGYVRLDMRRPVVLDSYGKVLVPAEYELCQLCGGRRIYVGQFRIFPSKEEGWTILLRRAGFLYSFLPFGWIRMDVCEDCFRNIKEYCEDHAGGKENE